MIEDFAGISNEAVSISEDITDKGAVTGKNIELIKDFCDQIEAKADAKDTDWLYLLFKSMAMIGWVLTIIAETGNWLDKPEDTPLQDIEQLKEV